MVKMVVFILLISAKINFMKMSGRKSAFQFPHCQRTPILIVHFLYFRATFLAASMTKVC